MNILESDLNFEEECILKVNVVWRWMHYGLKFEADAFWIASDEDMSLLNDQLDSCRRDFDSRCISSLNRNCCGILDALPKAISLDDYEVHLILLCMQACVLHHFNGNVFS